MDWAIAIPLTTAIIGVTLGYIVKRACDAAENLAEPWEYMDSVDLPPELARDETILLVTYFDDDLGWGS